MGSAGRMGISVKEENRRPGIAGQPANVDGFLTMGYSSGRGNASHFPSTFRATRRPSPVPGSWAAISP